MPAQHARGYAFGEAELKDALGVLGFDRDPLVDLLAVVLAGELFEKGGGRELLFIADDDELVGARDGAERIDGLDLARDRKSTRLNSRHYCESRMPSAA